MRVAIIGGGAAGFFTAINLKEMCPSAEVTIYEAASEPLAKVRISGGGRCNLTNSFQGEEPLSKIYPRGERVMRHALKVFTPQNCCEWFESRGVRLTTQADGCLFPASQSSEEIIDTFITLCRKLSIEIRCNHKIVDIKKQECFTISTNNDLTPSVECDVVVATTGGAPSPKGVSYLKNLPLNFTKPCPSLFSVKLSDPITELMGIVVEEVSVSLKGTKHRASGALLVTHWGVSGPAILKLSSYASRHLAECNYQGDILINWIPSLDDESIRAHIRDIIAKNSQKLVSSLSVLSITNRLWRHLLQRSDISLERRWAELGSKGINRIVATLICDEYTITGKSTHAAEFVTCGGVETKSIEIKTLEARQCKGLYLAGELLDVDAITGGFNLQAAWSMGYLVAREVANSIINK